MRLLRVPHLSQDGLGANQDALALVEESRQLEGVHFIKVGSTGQEHFGAQGGKLFRRLRLAGSGWVGPGGNDRREDERVGQPHAFGRRLP